MKKYWPTAEKYWLIGAVLLIVFLGLHLPALHLPYHQDEWKAVWSVAQGADSAGSMFAHPPLTALAFRLDATIFGLNNMRVLPLIFSVISAALLFLVVRKRSDIITGLIAVGLYTVCFYAILASLMIDTDGAILPTLFLLAVYAYDTAKAPQSNKRILRWSLVAIILIIGCLVKLSFVLVIAAVAVDFLLDHRQSISKKNTISAVLALIVFLIMLVIIFFGLHFVYSQFSLGSMIDHARSFMHIRGRNYSQVIFEGIKALLYLSPLLVMPLVFIRRETFEKTRLYWIYLIFGFIFYFILFDFSRGTLDKYLMFTIIPLCAITATVIRDVFSGSKASKSSISGRSYALLAGIVLSLGLYFVQFVNNYVPSLYPKTEWLNRVIHLKWNMLIPFNGGSGPMGFYVSFLFIALVFLISFVIMIAGIFKPTWRQSALAILICLGLTYSLIFTEEYVFGKISGSASEVLRSSLTYVKADKSGDQYITYNDIGAYELSAMHKYAGRFYVAPELEGTNLERLGKFNGKYLIVDMPRIDTNSGYAIFFKSCTVLASSTSGQIKGYIYSCNRQAQ